MVVFAALTVLAGLPASTSAHCTTTGPGHTGLSPAPSGTGGCAPGTGNGQPTITHDHHEGEEPGQHNTTHHHHRGEGTRETSHDHRHGHGRRSDRDDEEGARSDAHAPTTTEEEVADATIAGALIAFLALLATAGGISRSRFQARQRLTYEVVGRLEDLALMEHRALTSSFLRGGLRPPKVPEPVWATMGEQERLESRADVWEQISNSSAVEDRETVLRIVAFPNMLEAIAGMYNQRLINHRVVKTRVAGEAQDFWQRAGWWIDMLRAQYKGYEGDNIFVDLEIMLRRLDEGARPRQYKK